MLAVLRVGNGGITLEGAWQMREDVAIDMLMAAARTAERTQKPAGRAAATAAEPAQYPKSTRITSMDGLRAFLSKPLGQQ